jgi:phosphoribosylanthranilate isomerase
LTAYVPDRVVRVKICGVTRVEDAIACAVAGADWIGLNFHSASPRFVRPASAAAIIAALPSSVRAVGVFVDRPPAEVADIAGELGLDIVQLHGHEPPEDLILLRHLELIRAFGLDGPCAWQQVNEYLSRAIALGRAPDAVLVDAAIAGRSGGTGELISDHVLSQRPSMPRLILAGGLTPANVAERVARVQPWMVDVASGVESAPGVKDVSKAIAFVAAARSIVVQKGEKSN